MSSKPLILLTIMILVISTPASATFASNGGITSSNIHQISAINACCKANLVYDSMNKYVYAIDNYNDSNIYVISSATNKIIATLTGPRIPIAYLFANNELFVSYGKYIAVIKGTHVVAKITYKYGFVGWNCCLASTMVYDSANKEIFMPIGGANQNANDLCLYLGALNTVTNELQS